MNFPEIFAHRMFFWGVQKCNQKIVKVNAKIAIR